MLKRISVRSVSLRGTVASIETIQQLLQKMLQKVVTLSHHLCYCQFQGMQSGNVSDVLIIGTHSYKPLVCRELRRLHSLVCCEQMSYRFSFLVIIKTISKRYLYVCN